MYNVLIYMGLLPITWLHNNMISGNTVATGQRY